ncbi:MAG: hypothetical protein AAF235_02470 [Planctomycetota bacterium]
MRTLTTLAAVVALTLGAFQAVAEDIVTLTTGEKIEGQIVREVDGNIWVVVSYGAIERERFVAAVDISSIERDAISTEAAAAAKDEQKAPKDTAPRPGVPRGAVISLEGTVGMEFNAFMLEELIPVLEEDLGSDGSGIVVFKIRSGGGALLEIQKLSDMIEYEYKPRFQVVAWIDSAISAAAMTAHAIEEIYFMPHGNYGACTGWSGNLQAVSGLSYVQVLIDMEKISERGGYDHTIMKAMQGHPDENHFGGAWPLSYTIDENGDVTWFQDADTGEVVLNEPGDVLTLTSEQALAARFSKGTARNLDELAELMKYDEIEWIGEPVEDRVYPVSRAEQQMIRFRERTSEDQRRLGEYFANYNILKQAAAGANEESRGKLVGRARSHLGSIKSVMRTNPNLILFQLNLPTEQDYRYWLEDEEEELREIAARN